VNREHPHLAAHVLDRDAHASAPGGWWQNSTLRALSGSRWNLSELSTILSLLSGYQRVPSAAFPKRLPLPERWREQRKDGEYLEPAEEHAEREHDAPEGVDDLEALRGPDLIQPRPDVV
jgi:hypothetical protein